MKFEETAVVAGVGALPDWETHESNADRTAFFPLELDSLFHELGRSVDLKLSVLAARF